LIITYEGLQYQFDMDDITVQQALAIEEYMKCSFAEWGKKLEEGGDLRARQVLGWLILHPAGDVEIKATNFKLVALGNALDEAFAAQARQEEAAAGPVPTGAVLNGHPPAAESSPVSSLPSSGGI